ncbi:MAG: hypothetical protein ACRDVG_14075 [Jatrophihabitantaceae bacterium]
MSITNDIRNYADTALEQGKHAVGQATAQFTGITGAARTNVSTLGAKAADTVTDLRTQAEKTLNLDAIKSAVEPYLAQAKQYRATMTDRAEGLFDSVYGTVKSDERVAKVLATAESVTGAVVDTVTERVVKPVVSITGRGGKKPATKAAATKPASTRSAVKKAPAAKTTAKSTAKSPAKKSAQNTSAKKTTQS